MISFRRKNLLAAMVFLVAEPSACASGNAGTSNSSAPPNHAAVPHSVPFVVLHSGINSGYTRLSEFVIRDGDEFTRRWRGVLQGAPDAAKPEINFEKTSVVLVATGARNTGGYTVHVDSVIAAAGAAVHYIVHYTVSSPGSRCMSLQELTSPVEVISLDRFDGEVKFEKKSVSGAC